jgi:apolipoprotein N-acyltransferase
MKFAKLHSTERKFFDKILNFICTRKVIIGFLLGVCTYFAFYNFVFGFIFSLALLFEKKILKKQLHALEGEAIQSDLSVKLTQFDHKMHKRFWFWYSVGYIFSATHWIIYPFIVVGAEYLIPICFLVWLLFSYPIYRIFFSTRNASSLFRYLLIISLFTLYEVVLNKMNLSWLLAGQALKFDLLLLQPVRIFPIYTLTFISMMVWMYPYLLVEYFFTKHLKKSLVLRITSGLLVFFVPIILGAYYYLGYKIYYSDNLARNSRYEVIFLDKNNLNLSSSDLSVRDLNKMRVKGIFCIVQPNIDQKDKSNSTEKVVNIVHSIDKSMSGKFSKKVTIIMPETSIFDDIEQEDYFANLNSNLIIGGFRYDIDDMYNSMFVISSGQVVDFYDKYYLAPFVETIPFIEEIIDFMQRQSNFADSNIIEILKNSHFKKASVHWKVYQLHGVKFIPMICYDSCFSGKNNNYKNSDADMIICITNNAWFMNSIALQQHFEHTRIKAIEMGILTVISANTGISAVIKF